MRKIIVAALVAFAFLFTSSSVFAQDKEVKKDVKKETVKVEEKKDVKMDMSNCASKEEKKGCCEHKCSKTESKDDKGCEKDSK